MAKFRVVGIIYFCFVGSSLWSAEPVHNPPTACNFESGNCGWYEDYKDEYDWTLGSGRTTSNIRYMAPLNDRTRNTPDGWYMFVNDDAVLKNTFNAKLNSPTYFSNYSECKIKFSYYLYQTVGSLTLDASFTANGTTSSSKIWSVNGSASTKASWQDVIVWLGGGRRKLFTLHFVLTGATLGKNHGVIAVDDVGFYDCIIISRPHPGRCTSDYYQCRDSSCIPRSKLCDLTYDCGDSSDEEMSTCDSYHRYDFEQPTEFSQGLNKVEDDFEWERRSGPTPSRNTGPSRDHTTGTREGYYMYVEATNRRYKERTWLLMRPFKAESADCRVRFFYHMYGERLGRLAVKIRTHRNGEAREIWGTGGLNLDVWLPSNEINLPSSSSDFQVIFEGEVGISWRGDIAIDDVSFSPGCKFSDSQFLPLAPVISTIMPQTTTRRPSNCSKGQFECVSKRTCIDRQQVCDFREDCEDASDEVNCPKLTCTFENNRLGLPGQLCGWKIEIEKSDLILHQATYKWEIARGSGVNRPDTDHTNQSPRGYYLLADSRPGGHTDASNFTATISKTGPQCHLSFWYYMTGAHLVSQSRSSIAVLYQIGGELHELAAISHQEGNDWQRELVPIGAHDDIRVIIQTRRGVSKTTGIAIDDMSFLDCDPPQKNEKCTADELPCISGGCFSRGRECDYGKDCGDSSDEDGRHCDTIYKARCDFEHGMCRSWSHDRTGDYYWRLKKGGTPSLQTGPDCDQSEHSKEGFFIYLETSWSVLEGETARLKSRVIKGGVRDCKLRYWYHMKGQQIGSLRIIRRYSFYRNENATITLKEHRKDQGRYWVRGEVDLTQPDKMEKRNFQVVFEGVVGSGFLGDIALDSLSMTPGCEEADDNHLPGESEKARLPQNNCTDAGLHQCYSGECFHARQKCNFVKDCKDGTDEAGCGHMCSFRSGTCNWRTQLFGSSSATWIRVKHESTSKHKGYFLKANIKPDSAEKAILESPRYSSASHSCSFNFLYQIYDPSHTAALKINIEDRYGHVTNVWSSAQKNVSTDWQEGLADIGGHVMEDFKVLVEAVGDPKTTVNIDDIEFQDCAKASHSECAEDQFLCRDHASCVNNRYVCDGTPDCNDESDEDDAFCVLHEGDCDFERDFESCGWENSGEWERELVRTLENNYRTKRSTTSLFYAVADFDKARQGKPGDIASLSPKEIFPASQGKCYLRFSYRMYDPQAGVNGTEDNMGTLKVSTVNRNSVASLMWIKSGNQGRKWQKANLLLGNNDNFTVLFEAIRGDGPRSKIAINDVTFTPECRGAPSPTYNSSKTCDFTHFFCSTSNKCMPKSWLCDGKPDCGEYDEKDCPPITGQSTPATTTALSGPTSDPRPNYTKPPQTCGKGKFTCADGACIYGSLYCDGVSDCTGGEDEYGCKFQCRAHGAMLCHNGDQCGILCDSTSNCPDGSDEASCNENLCLKHHKYCYGGSNCTYTSGKGTTCLNCPLSNAGPRCYNKAELVTPSTQSSTTSTAASPCGNGKKPCKDGTCLVASKFCNFNYDCPDMSDEDSCPAVCTFEDDNTCQWQSKKCTGCFEWKLVKAEAMSPLVAPKFDHTLETKTGGFMFVESKGHLEKRERKTQLISPIFTQGGLTCSISFWFYVSCRECKLNLLVNSTAGQVVLWRWEARTPTDGEKWTLSQVVLPVCLKDFQIMIEAEMLIGWSGGIAVDDIRLEECHYKRNMFVPGYFNCTDGNYIKNDKICDFQTDCCGGNDEDTKMCTNQEIVKCDFESGWCGWQRLNGETEWIRNSGSTPSINTGPIGDHTYRTTNGYYLYVESSRPAVLNDKARIGLYLNRTSTKEPCQVRFWYHMYGTDVHTLSFYVKNFTSEPKLLAQAVGEKGNEWLRERVDISEPGPFQVIIEAVIGNSYMGDIAIDDFSYKGCSIYTGPTPSVTPTHVTMTPIKYPTNCHFEINSCNWHEFYQDNFDWHWGSGHSTLNERNRAPRIDHSRGSANGHYMYVKDNAGGNSATSRNAFLRSETFQTTSSECKIQFYYYLNTTKTDRTTDTRLGLTIIQHEQNNPEKASLIWQQAKNMGAQWNRAVVGVGRRSEPFMFEFVCYGIGAESRIVAIDDIIFYDCTLGEPTNSCDQQTMFHCPKTKVCLQRNFLCDLTDQCGEREDEAENLCEGYKQQNFENDLGDFYQGKDGTDDDFNWIRRNGSTPSFDTGPDTDHTLYTNSGHYIHIESSKPRKAGEKAWLLSHVFTATNQKEPCNMRFFRHMYGENVDRLAVYVRYSRSGPGSRLIWEAQGEAGNFWSRVEVVLDEKDDFQVIFEGRVGTGWKGDIAIDDISFTPGCKYSDTPLPQDKAVDDDLNEGQSHDVAIAVPVTIILLAIIVVTVILLARRQRTLRMEQKNSNLYSSTRDITVDNPTFEAESGMQQIVNPLYDRSRDKTPRKL